MTKDERKKLRTDLRDFCNAHLRITELPHAIKSQWRSLLLALDDDDPVGGIMYRRGL